MAIIGNEYRSAISPPTAPDHSLHMAIYRRYGPVSTTAQDNRSSSPSNATIPLKTRPCAVTPRSRMPTIKRYPVFRLIYEGGTRSIHKLFVQTASEGPVCGLYLQVTGTPETGMRYSEVPGDDPERAMPGPLIRKTCMGSISADSLDRFRDICRRGHPQRPPPGPDCRTCTWQPTCHSQEWVQDTIDLSVADGILDIGN
ncbi:hypothetical protein VFPPC_17713 [Pochonia chlamydosporia 170]|uniref:Uncharacterized protein n=1 Tax=Pochonia chlamydosporia 170 TaxID=1380566 RepID=A0A219AQT2_METCM|nr:hypothetical protein VFPPC_17713 [Pochonia chlamydosporia 170]OWT43111.1 hypothetical protein VFPPC_17713 [Pochonia chlamydosporia 170]